MRCAFASIGAMSSGRMPCAIAARLGMKTLILDDGWQSDGIHQGYSFCGDWQISSRRFPNMATPSWRASRRMSVSSECICQASASIFDTFGRAVKAPKLAVGVCEVEVPCAGYLRISY